MQDDNSIFLSGEGGVQKFPRKQTARVGQDEKHRAELAALRLVDGQRVCEFESRIAFLGEIAVGEVVLEMWLGRKFDF